MGKCRNSITLTSVAEVIVKETVASFTTSSSSFECIHNYNEWTNMVLTGCKTWNKKQK